MGASIARAQTGDSATLDLTERNLLSYCLQCHRPASTGTSVWRSTILSTAVSTLGYNLVRQGLKY